MFGYYGFFLVVITFGCITYVFSFFVTMGSTQAEQDLKGFSVSDRVQAIHLDDALIVGSVLNVLPLIVLSSIRDQIKILFQ